MSRAKGGVVARRSHKKIMARAKGYFSRRKNIFRVAVQAVEKAEQISIPRSSRQEAQFPRPLDSAHQRRYTRTWRNLRTIYQRPQQGWDHRGPQGSV
jgi:Ribosomal protein L20